MSTFELIFIVPNTVDNKLVRKLVFAPKGVPKDDPAYFRASLLAGPWKKETRLCKGTLDGAPIVAHAPFILPLRLTQSKDRGEDMLVLSGVSVTVTDPTIEPVVDESGTPTLGKNGRPLFDLKGGKTEVVTHTFASGNDDAAFATAPKAPAASESVDEAFL